MITRYSLFKNRSIALNEVSGIYDGYYGLSLKEFRMSDLYQITALSAQSTIEIFNGNDTFQEALLPTSSLWTMIDVGYKSCTVGMYSLLKENYKKSDTDVFQDLLYMSENKDRIRNVAKVLKQSIKNFESYLNTIQLDQINNLKKVKIERSEADYTDASSPIDVVQKEILIKTRKYRNPIYMIGVFLTNLIGNAQPAQTFLGLSDFVKKYDIQTFHSIFGEKIELEHLEEFEDVIDKPLKKMAESIQDTYYHMRYYDLIPGADNAWRSSVIIHCLEVLIDQCILIEDSKMSVKRAQKFSEELKAHSQTRTWIGYEGIQEGSVIKSIQRILQSMGLFRGGITGKFGDLTHQGVISFQENAINEDGKKLTVDGRVGKHTRWALENLDKSYLPYIKEAEEKKKEESISDKPTAPSKEKDQKPSAPKKEDKKWPEIKIDRDGKPDRTIVI